MSNDNRRRRPVGVWLISLFCVLSPGWTLLSYLLIGSGAIPVNASQEAYLNSLGIAGYVLSIGASVAILAAGITLFLLKKVSFWLFVGGLTANLLLTVWQALTKGWVSAIGGSGLLGALLAWILLVAVCVYVWSLRRRGVLT